MSISMNKILTTVFFLLTTVIPAFSQTDGEPANGDVAKKLANPVCAIYAVPIEYDHYNNVGKYDGTMDVITLKPMIPVALNDNWSFVSRTIIPYVWQDGIIPTEVTMMGTTFDTKSQLGYKNAGKNNGFWDIQEQMFITPSKKYYGFSWGAGAVLGFPGSNEIAGISNKYTAGPIGAIVREDSIFTYGVLSYHSWSYAGQDKDYAKSGSKHALAGVVSPDGLDLEVETEDVNKTFVQPFLTLRFPTYTGLSLTSESTYNFKTDKWSVPVIGLVTQIVKIGPQILQLKIGGHYWLTDNENDPDGWGYRGAVTLLFQK